MQLNNRGNLLVENASGMCSSQALWTLQYHR